MKKYTVTISIIVLVLSCITFSQYHLEPKYENLTKLAEYFRKTNFEYIPNSIDLGSEILSHLTPLKDQVTEIKPIYDSFTGEYMKLGEDLLRINNKIDLLRSALKKIKSYDIIGDSYHGKYTIVYDKKSVFFAINGRIPLRNRNTYRLESTGQTLKIRAKYSFDDRNYWIYNLYKGNYEQELEQLYKQNQSKNDKFGSLIKKVVSQLVPIVAKSSKITLDSILLLKTSEFEQNLKLKDFIICSSILKKLQFYFDQTDTQNSKYEELSNRLYLDHFHYIEELINNNDFKSAEDHLIKFRDINWNKTDIEYRFNDLNVKLIKVRAQKNFLSENYFNSYQDYLILMKKINDDEIDVKFLEAFMAYYNKELEIHFTSREVDQISALFDSLVYYYKSHTHIKGFETYLKAKYNRLREFIDEITLIDYSLNNYYFIPGGEHYLESIFTQSNIRPFLLLKTPADSEFWKLLELCAVSEGTTRDKKLIMLGLSVISPLHRDYVNAGGWMSIAETEKYKKTFFPIAGLENGNRFLVLTLDKLEDGVLAKMLQEKSVSERANINQSIIDIRKKNGFTPFNKGRIGFSWGGGFTTLTNAKSYDPQIFLDNVEMGTLHVGLGLAIILNSTDLLPIPEGDVQPAFSYLEASLGFVYGAQFKRSTTENVSGSSLNKDNVEYTINNSLQRFDLGIGIHHYVNTYNNRSLLNYYRFRLGLSFSFLQKTEEPTFKSNLKTVPFISIALSILELYASFDLKESKLHQIGLAINFNRIF
jgi:hypothetical protein